MSSVAGSGPLDRILPCYPGYAMGGIIPKNTIEIPFQKDLLHKAKTDIEDLEDKKKALPKVKDPLTGNDPQRSLNELNGQIDALKLQVIKIQNEIASLEKESKLTNTEEMLPIDHVHSRLLHPKKADPSESQFLVVIKDSNSAQRQLDQFTKHLTKMRYMPRVVQLINDMSQLVLDKVNREKHEVCLLGSFITLGRTRVFDPIVIRYGAKINPELKKASVAEKYLVICETVQGAVFVGFSTRVTTTSDVDSPKTEFTEEDKDVIKKFTSRLEVFCYESQGAIPPSKGANLYETYEGWKKKLDEDQESGFPIAFKVRNLKEVLEENDQIIQEDK